MSPRVISPGPADATVIASPSRIAAPMLVPGALNRTLYPWASSFSLTCSNAPFLLMGSTSEQEYCHSSALDAWELVFIIQ